MKKVYFILNDNTFHRYIYLLIKFFLLEGFKVYIKFNFRFLRSLSLYSELLLKEKNVKVFSFTRPKDAIVFSDKKEENIIFLSPDYFSEVANNEQVFFYRVPIAMHPLMYFKNLWDKPVTPKVRLKTAIFIGATSGYSKLKKVEKLFDVTNREDLLNYMKEKSFTVLPTSQFAFDNFSKDKHVIIADRKNIKVTQDELRSCFSKYYFLLAASGYIMPLCHNLVEAMSVGTIPIIEKGYASLLTPSLVHGVNAIVYDSLEDISDKIQEAFDLPVDDLNRMVENVLHYYEEYLTPKKVVGRIINQTIGTVYLNAEEGSVKLIDRI